MSKVKDYSNLHKTGPKKGYKKNRKKRHNDSYLTYLDNRESWEKKGYALDPVMSRKTFEEEYENAKKLGMKNISREFAKADRVLTKDSSMEIAEKSLKRTGDPYTHKDVLDLAKQLRSADFDSTLLPDEVFYGEDGQEYTVRSQSDRQQLFIFLIGNGYTREEAEEAMY